MTNDLTQEPTKPLQPLRPVTPGRPLPYVALGGSGHLRSDNEPIIDARNDLEAVAFWLWERAGDSQKTKDSYWLHIERLLLWASEIKNKSLSDLSANDFAEYRDFLLDPRPRHLWCGPRAPRGSSRWRPFRGPLSPSSQRLSMNIISSLMSFLCAAGYLRANPTLLLRKPKSSQRQRKEETVERFLDEGLLRAITETLDQMPKETQAQHIEAERARWVFVLMTTLGLRRDEVVTHTQGAFEKRVRPSGIQWWCRIVGKGSKLRVIPVPHACLRALFRYRACLGLQDEPSPEESTPLVMSLRGGKAASDTTLYRIIKELCRRTADTIEPKHPHGAAHLRKASPHWLRHSYITAQGNMGVSLRHRKLSAGHASIETTSRYDHAVEDEWYREMQLSPLDDWCLRNEEAWVQR